MRFRVFRTLLAVLLWIVVAACLAATIVPHFLDRIYYRGPGSAHFDGGRFFNPDGEDTAHPPGRGGRAGFLLRYLSGRDDRPPWPERVRVVQARPPATVAGDQMVVTWVGHATVLVQTASLNILTDPIWADRAGPLGLGPTRVAAPGIAFADLPKIDLVLVSHSHYDHLDLQTLRRLWERDRPLVVTSLGNDSVIGQVGVPARALDWGGRLAVRAGVEVAVTRNHHWGSRWFTDRNRALWSSFIVRLPGGNLFFAGDTGLGDGRWAEEARALGPIRLALIPIGAFRFSPGEMGTASHIGPVQAAEVFRRLGAWRGVAVHWGTFRLSDEAWDTPPRLLGEAMRCAGQTAKGARFGALGIGETVEVPPIGAGPALQPVASACLDRSAVRALR